MKKFVHSVLMFFVASIMAGGCDSAPQKSVPGQKVLASQSFTQAMDNADPSFGQVKGQIKFSSAYAQRSATFQIDNRKFVTEPDGWFLIEKIPAGTYNFQVRIRGYEGVQFRFNVDSNALVNLKPVPMAHARGRVVGRLVDDQGRSAASVPVILIPQGGMAVTDKEGIFQFMGVSGGDHSLITKNGMVNFSQKGFHVNSGEMKNLGNIQVDRQPVGTINPSSKINTAN